MKIIYLTLLVGVALVAPLRAETNIGDVEKMSSQEFSQMLDRNLGKAKTEPVPEPTPAPVQSVSATPAHEITDNERGYGATVIFFLLLAVAIYFFPSLVGGRKKNANAIFVLNLFTGWSFIGWVIALVWACTVSDSDPAPKPLPQLPAKNPDPRGFWERWRMDDL